MKVDLIGKNIKTLRKQKKITLQELSDNTGFTKSYLSKIERSVKEPPYSTVNRIAAALEVEVTYLLREMQGAANDVSISVVRKNQGKVVEARDRFFGTNYKDLAFDKPGKNMRPFIIEPPFEIDGGFKHEGEEFIYVLEGNCEFIYKGKKYVLEATDSAYFDSNLPHSAKSLGDKKAKVLSIIYNYKRF